jgi:hypothetical protein
MTKQIQDLSGVWSIEFQGVSIHVPMGSILRLRGQDMLLSEVELPPLVEAETRMMKQDVVETNRHVRARLGCSLSMAKDIVDFAKEHAHVL